MHKYTKFAKAAGLSLALIVFATSAQATSVWVDQFGNSGSAPAAQNPMNDPIFFTETLTPDAGINTGKYEVTNNTNGFDLIAFGVSNADTQAYFSELFTIGSVCSSGLCYDAFNLNASNWASSEIDFDDNTGADIFGDFSNVIDPGDNTINFYQVNNNMPGEGGALTPGSTSDLFLFGDGILSSQMFVVLQSQENGQLLFGHGIQPLNVIPLPAAAWLFISAIAGLGWMRRHRQGRLRPSVR